MKLQTCRRHPSAGRFLATCSGCAQELYDIEAANRAQAAAKANEFSTRVRNALGLPRYPMPDPRNGEDVNRVSMWSVRELNDVFLRVGGEVSIREVVRDNGCDEPYTTNEVKICVNLPGVGWVYAFTDWDPAGEAYSFDLPVIRALNTLAAAV